MAAIDHAREIKRHLDDAHRRYPRSRALAALHKSLAAGLRENAEALGLSAEDVVALGGGTEKDGG